MPQPPTLTDALKPRPSIFDRSKIDTVSKLGDLDSLPPDAFFAENYLTEAMRTLLPEAFKRLEQRHDSAAGIYHLSQAMGGGKTHSLLALGLLAKHQAFRSRILGECGYAPGPLGSVRVLAFSGGEDPTPNGLWGCLAERAGRPEALKECYSPLRAPTESEWTKLLAGEPLLILLDELPPYFSSIRAIKTGSTSLDAITTVALRNLYQAIHTNQLSNVCLVVTDLAGTAYQAASGSLSSLADAEMETNRIAVSLSPVNLNTDELYRILRKQLFSEMPADAQIASVANGYLQAVERACNVGLLTDVPGSLRQRFIEAYPFHPAIRDLYARVKGNAGFHQTRALIRIARIMARHLWDSGAAREKHLIAAHDYDLLDPAMKSEIAQINSTFEAAVAKDIQAGGGTATAQGIDGSGGRTRRYIQDFHREPLGRRASAYSQVYRAYCSSDDECDNSSCRRKPNPTAGRTLSTIYQRSLCRPLSRYHPVNGGVNAPEISSFSFFLVPASGPFNCWRIA